jgi:hydrogenase expression/formation protein HypC
MCLGVPGRIVDIYEKNSLTMGKVDFGGGVLRETCLAYIPDAQIGNYTIIHVGFALSILSETEALETLALLTEIANLNDEPDQEPAL